MQLNELTAHELGEKLKAREITAVELAKSVYDRISAVDEKIGGYITLTEEMALEQASIADAGFDRGDEMPKLAGIPIAVKDVICTKGVLTTCASRILENFVSPYNATVVEKLNGERAVMVGKTNMDEFAMGSSTENSAHGVTLNPWNTEYVPGGSSGGSAAVVAADSAIASLGTDTGGSIRQPAAFCGVVGIKPTYGRVSRFGMVAFASSLDQIGAFSKDVTDCAIMLNAICGYDAMDSTSAKIPVPDFTQSLSSDVKGLKIGIPKEYFVEGMDKEVEASVRSAIEKFSELGAIVEELSLPHTEYAIATYYIIAPAEASTNLARYDGVRYGRRADDVSDLVGMYRKTRSQGFRDEVKRRIMLGTYVLSSGYYDAYYLKAQKVRTLVKEDFDRAFEKVDLIVTPVSPTTAFKVAERIDSLLQMYLSDIFTTPVNLAGLPGISIPCGFSGDGMPIGLQVIGKPFAEDQILRAAYSFEQATEHHFRKPIRTT